MIRRTSARRGPPPTSWVPRAAVTDGITGGPIGITPPANRRPHCRRRRSDLVVRPPMMATPPPAAYPATQAVFYEIYPSVRRLQRRRDRRPPRRARPSSTTWHGSACTDLVQPVLRLPVPRRGLRRVRLPAGRAPLRQQRRSDPARRRRPRARHPGLLDLVAGHTSVEHPWFRRSAATRPTTATSGRTGPARRSSLARVPARATT